MCLKERLSGVGARFVHALESLTINLNERTKDNRQAWVARTIDNCPCPGFNTSVIQWEHARPVVYICENSSNRETRFVEEVEREEAEYWDSTYAKTFYDPCTGIEVSLSEPHHGQLMLLSEYVRRNPQLAGLPNFDSFAEGWGFYSNLRDLILQEFNVPDVPRIVIRD